MIRPKKSPISIGDYGSGDKKKPPDKEKIKKYENYLTSF